jgi:hypothetical protein
MIKNVKNLILIQFKKISFDVNVKKYGHLLPKMFNSNKINLSRIFFSLINLKKKRREIV